MLRLAVCLALQRPRTRRASRAPRGAARPAVVELFTSEGCSSCPPAEAVLAELARRPDVLALAFHVEYWDSLGWRDRFGLPEAVRRQDQYARSPWWAPERIYARRVVLTVVLTMSAPDRRAIEAAVTGVRTGIAVEMTNDGGDLVVALGGGQCLAPSEVLLIAYLHKAISEIGRGRNGRTLRRV